MWSAEEQAQADRQIALSKRLALGLALSLLPAMGFGSVAAIWIGVRGRKEIEASQGKLAGRGVAAWCVGAGVVGLVANLILFWPMIFGRLS